MLNNNLILTWPVISEACVEHGCIITETNMFPIDHNECSIIVCFSNITITLMKKTELYFAIFFKTAFPKGHLSPP